MEPLKKLVADRLRTQPVGTHPDAEVLSAFAENALGPNERQSVLEHLSSCTDCRDILFFAAPSPEETQQVLAPAKPRRVFALRWGTLAACIVIAAAVLVTRRETPRNEQRLAKTVPAASSAPAQAGTEMVAAERPPAELNSLRDKDGAAAKTRVEPSKRGFAEPKDITALPAAPMAFESYDKVAAARADAQRDAKLQAPPVVNAPVVNVPMAGRNVGGPLKVDSGAAASKNEVSQAQVAEGNDHLSHAGSVSSAQDKTGGVIGGNLTPSPSAKVLQASKDAGHLGSVTGTVSDRSGALIANAKVTAVGPHGGERAVISDSAGKFSIDQLAEGTYQVNVDAPGFRKTVSEVAVLSQKPTQADFHLQVGSTTETVEVQAAAAPVETESQAVRANRSLDESAALAQSVVQAPPTMQTAELKKQKAAHLSSGVSAEMRRQLSAWRWSISPQGTVQRSNETGKTWQQVTVATGVVLRAVSSLANHVWAGGRSGALYHSTDSGQHWAQVVPSTGREKLQADITEIQLPDSQHVTVSTSDGQTWTTADGGQTWSIQ